MFPVPSDDDEVPAGVRELGDRSGDDLREALLAIGVHVTERLVMVPFDEDPAIPRLVMQGFVGDIAFSDRVLHPQVTDDVEVLADIEDATAAAEYEAIRQSLLKDDDG